MKKIAKLGLSAVAAFALMFTTTISVVAQEKATFPSSNTDTKKEVKIVSKKLAPSYAWYDLEPTTNTNQSNQLLETGSTGTPPPTSGSGCTQENTDGEFCKVLIKSASGRVSWPSVPQGTSVSALIASDSDLSLGDDDDTQDSNMDGYSRTDP